MRHGKALWLWASCARWRPGWTAGSFYPPWPARSFRLPDDFGRPKRHRLRWTILTEWRSDALPIGYVAPEQPVSPCSDTGDTT